MMFNSRDNLKRWRAHLLNESSDYPVLEDLEDSWKLLESYYNYEIKDLIDRDDIGKSTPLQTFMYMVDSGFYPPPEVLLALYDCFEVYMDMKGKVELEEVFFGKRKRGIGNYSARFYRLDAYRSLQFNLATNDAMGIKKSQTEEALKIIELYKLSDDVDSFLRGFRRYKNKWTK